MRTVSYEFFRMAGPIDADDQSESAVPPGLHARNGVFYNHGSLGIHLQSPRCFHETIGGRLPRKMKSFAFDAVDPLIEGIREAGPLQNRSRVFAG